MDKSEFFEIFTSAVAAALICADKMRKEKNKKPCLGAMCCSLENVINFSHNYFEEEMDDKAKSLLEYISFLKNVDDSYTVYGVKEDEDILCTFGFEEPVSIKEFTVTDSASIVSVVVEHLLTCFYFSENTGNNGKKNMVHKVFDEVKRKVIYISEKSDGNALVVFTAVID